MRGIDAGCKAQVGCASIFAIVNLDFEPADAFDFVDKAPGRRRGRAEWMDDDTWAAIERENAEDQRHYTRVFADAIEAELGGAPIRAVLTRLDFHEVDSSDRAFTRAAARAVRALHRRVPFVLDGPVRGVSVRDEGTYVRGVPFRSEITVDFEPAGSYAFVNASRLSAGYAKAVDEVFRIETEASAVRVVLTEGKRLNVDERRFRDVAVLAVRRLRAYY